MTEAKVRRWVVAVREGPFTSYHEVDAPTRELAIDRFWATWEDGDFEAKIVSCTTPPVCGRGEE